MNINYKWAKERWIDGEGGLKDMCDFGVQNRNNEILRFDVFNCSESDYVRIYMDTHHKGIPYFITKVC